MPIFAQMMGPTESGLVCCCAVHPGALCSFLALAFTLTTRYSSPNAGLLGLVGMLINALVLLVLLMGSASVRLLVMQGGFLTISTFTFVFHYFRPNEPPPPGPIPRWPERAALQEKWNPQRKAGELPGDEHIREKPPGPDERLRPEGHQAQDVPSPGKE